MAQDYLVPWLNASGQGGLRNSMLVAAGDGSTLVYNINFSGGFITKTDIKAYTFNPATGLTTELTITSGMWTGASQITLVSPVPVGQYIVIYRDTQKTSPLVNFTTGAILNEPNLDKMAQQCVFIAAEMLDRFDAVNDGSTLAITNSATALSTANTALAQSSAAVSTANATNSTASAAQTAAAAAVTTANAASTTANAIDGKAQSALDASAAAVSTANTAKSTADGLAASIATANTNASNAVSTANTASTTANTAKSTADGLAASIATANTNASNAVSTANTAAAQVGQLSGRNRIINGCFRIAQRSSINLAGTAGTYVEGFGGPDRWVAGNSAGGTLTQDWQAFLFNGRNYPGVRHLVTAVPTNLTGGNYWSGHLQRMEAVNVFDLHDGPIAISFPFVSTVSGTFSVSVRVPQGTAYSYVTTFTAVANTPKLVTINVPQLPSAASIDRTSSVGLLLHIGALNTGTLQCSTANLNSWQTGTFISAQGATNWAASIGNSIMSSEVQLEAGAVATPFERRLYGQELALCQRYYEVGTQPLFYIGFGGTSGYSAAYGEVRFKTDKRASPTVTQSGWQYYSGGANTAMTATLNPYTEKFSFNVTGMTNWQGWNGAGTWTASAEL